MKIQKCKHLEINELMPIKQGIEDYSQRAFTEHTCDDDASRMLSLTNIIARNNLVLSAHLLRHVGNGQYLLTVVTFENAHFGCALKLVVITEPLDARQRLTSDGHSQFKGALLFQALQSNIIVNNH